MGRRDGRKTKFACLSFVHQAGATLWEESTKSNSSPNFRTACARGTSHPSLMINPQNFSQNVHLF